MCHIHQTHTSRVTGETHSVWMRDGRAEDAAPRSTVRPRLNSHHIRTVGVCVCGGGVKKGKNHDGVQF